MAGQFPMGDLALDQKQGESRINNVAAESWLEPLLCKSNFYRSHFTRDGRREAKSTRRGSAIDVDIAVRKNSIASRNNSVSAPSEAVGAIGSEPAPAAERRDSAEEIVREDN